MKKIALLLVMALAFTSIATAADVTVGGWVDFRGDIQIDGDKYQYDDTKTPSIWETTDEEKKPKLNNGNTEWELAAVVTGEGWGGRIGLDMWTGANGHKDYKSLTTNNSYIYADFNDAVRFYSGIRMQPIMYTAWPAVESFNAQLADNNGLGLGAYNYGGLGRWTTGYIETAYTGKQTGFILELKPTEGFETAVVFSNGQDDGSNVNFEDAVKNNLIFNAKYSMDLGTFYAGAALKDTANALWLEADLKLVENLSSDLKFEMVLTEEDSLVVKSKITAITANIAYNVPEAVKVALQSTFMLLEKDKVGQDYQVVNSLSVAPVVPVVNPTLFAYYNMGSEDKSSQYGVKLNIAKSIGQVTNNFYVAWDGDNSALEKSNTTIGIKTTLWF